MTPPTQNPVGAPQAPVAPAPPAMPVEAQMALADAMRMVQVQRPEVDRVIRALSNRREMLSRRLDRVSGPESQAMRAEIAALDGQMSAVQARVVDVMAQAGQGVHVEVVPGPMMGRGMMLGGPHWIDPDAVTAVFVMFSIGVIVPLSVGLTRRLWRRPAPPLPRESDMMASPRLERLEQAVDAIAIEIERISEGQRFVTKLLSERSAPGKGGAPSDNGDLGLAQSGRQATTPH